jgi:hypothetical protein
VRSAALACAALLLATSARGGEALPDPTRPEIAVPAAAEPEAAAERLELRAVLIGKGRRIAVINGRALGVGDAFAGVEVLSIEPGRVRVRTPDGERELALAGAVSIAPAEEWSR